MRRRRTPDRGSATAELAVSLPALLLLLVVGISALLVIRDEIECVDDAREAARAAARGDSIRQIEGATVTVAAEGGEVRVTVTRRRAPLAILPSIVVGATAVAAIEPS